jgi:hypothetical protein
MLSTCEAWFCLLVTHYNLITNDTTTVAHTAQELLSFQYLQ